MTLDAPDVTNLDTKRLIPDFWITFAVAVKKKILKFNMNLNVTPQTKFETVRRHVIFHVLM